MKTVIFGFVFLLFSNLWYSTYKKLKEQNKLPVDDGSAEGSALAFFILSTIVSGVLFIGSLF